MFQKLIQCDRIVLWGFCLRLTWNTCICVLTVWISTVCDMCGFSIGYMFFLRWKCHLQRKNVLGIYFFDLFPLVSGVLQPNEVMQPWCCLHTWCLQVPVPKNGQTFLSVTPRAVATITKDGIDVWNCWNSKSFFFDFELCTMIFMSNAVSSSPYQGPLNDSMLYRALAPLHPERAEDGGSSITRRPVFKHVRLVQSCHMKM